MSSFAMFEVPQGFAGVASVETIWSSLLLDENSTARTLHTQAHVTSCFLD